MQLHKGIYIAIGSLVLSEYHILELRFYDKILIILLNNFVSYDK